MANKNALERFQEQQFYKGLWLACDNEAKTKTAAQGAARRADPTTCYTSPGKTGTEELLEKFRENYYHS